ncbi:MAG: type II toxin-antitoxin system RelE/ParE family toxin [Methanomassiliicoccaceae archaeon]|nr:type II toxin-antitoxin system RelE/ParE family toxin [Methanomassiliicoccaceae archaeon]
MTYNVTIERSVLKYLGKLEPAVRERIMLWIKENLEGCKDPRSTGKAMHGKYEGAWRYRIGEYRVIAEIRDKELIVIVIDIGPRKNIYK